MEELADGFITVPGGIGTFEEFFEILTLKQLGRHEKPIVIFDINGYYESMTDMIEKAISKKFMTPGARKLFYVATDIDAALDYIEGYVPEKFNILELRNIKN